MTATDTTRLGARGLQGLRKTRPPHSAFRCGPGRRTPKRFGPLQSPSAEPAHQSRRSFAPENPARHDRTHGINHAMTNPFALRLLLAPLLSLPLLACRDAPTTGGPAARAESSQSPIAVLECGCADPTADPAQQAFCPPGAADRQGCKRQCAPEQCRCRQQPADPSCATELE